jgi:hydroxymethylglutaryl-CoA lyase
MTASTSFPRRVHLTEVGLRDGLQMEPTFVPTEHKLALFQQLVDAGVRRFELTSFVSPKAVPALADAAELVALAKGHAGVTLAALAPNARGIERALAAGVDEVVVFMSASETHNRKNLNRSVDRSLQDLQEAAALLRGSGVKLHCAIATALGCPFEGDVSLEQLQRLASAFAEAGATGVTLGDTTGMATPPRVRAAVEHLHKHVPGLPLTLHFHNTRGIGLVNVMEGLACGIDSYESSLGGIGGCPFAPGATGNICTEDTVHLLHEVGVETGIDLGKLCDAARELQRLLGHTLPGQVMVAGPRDRRFEAEGAVSAIGG